MINAITPDNINSVLRDIVSDHRCGGCLKKKKINLCAKFSSEIIIVRARCSDCIEDHVVLKIKEIFLLKIYNKIE